MKHIQIHRTYAKNFQFEINEKIMDEIPSSLSAWNPHIALQVTPRFRVLESGRYELVLAMQLNLLHQTQPLLSIYLEQSGLFTLLQIPEKQREKLLYGVCANLLFPYAGAAVNTFLAQAGLPPVYILPLDFVVLYQRYAVEQAQSKAAENFFVSSSYNEKTLH